ncbi:MAG: hypothetical protein AB7O97_00225 [Planctomycetota bacterium]
MTARRWIAVGLTAQAVIVATWWLTLLARPDLAAHFLPAGWPTAALFAFWPADLLLLVAGSVAGAIGIARRARWAPAMAWALAGAALYATLFCLGALLSTGSGVLAVAAMLPCAIGSCACAAAAGRVR